MFKWKHGKRADRFTLIPNIAQCIKLYANNVVEYSFFSVKKVKRALLSFCGQFNRPTEAAIPAIVTKFRNKFTLFNFKPSTRLRRLRSEENIAAVSASVTDDHQLSILAVRSNWGFVTQQLGKFSGRI